MKILVTGANGYIGRHVVLFLLNEGHDVIAADINISQIDARARRIQFDLFNIDETSIYDDLCRPDVCLHMAWRNGFIHDSSSHMLDLSMHYRFLTSLIGGGSST